MLKANFQNPSLKVMLLVLCLTFAGSTGIAFSFKENDDFSLAKQEIIFRKIGHEVLLHAGDRTSRVLPITKIGEQTYQIRFENDFTFEPDSLIKIVKKAFSAQKLGKDYVVSVKDCNRLDVIFGYSIAKNEQKDIIACSGRIQPKGCYLIEIKLEDTGLSTTQKGYLMGAIPLLAGLGLMFRTGTPARKKKNLTPSAVQLISIGETTFDTFQKTVHFKEEVQELTLKEYQILLILATLPNTVISRAQLQKEIWEDEGVIVGRSLDVFISKLRKKLSADASLQLMNIHGKGYKLAVLIPG